MDAAATVERAVQLFLRDNPDVSPVLACAIVQFNWDRGARELDDLIQVEQYANAFSDRD